MAAQLYGSQPQYLSKTFVTAMPIALSFKGPTPAMPRL